MDEAAYLAMVRRELPLRLHAMWQEDADYHAEGEPVTGFRPDPASITTGVADDGVPELVVVSEVHEPGRRHEDDVSTHRYDAEWRAVLDTRGVSYVDWVARRIHTGAGRRPALDPAQVTAASADLPGAGTLWRQMVDAVAGEVDDAGHVRVGSVIVAVDAEQWRELVVECEVEARNERGPDAQRSGDGPQSAVGALHDLLPGGWGGAGPWTGHVVWWRGELHASSRLELPPL